MRIAICILSLLGLSGGAANAAPSPTQVFRLPEVPEEVFYADSENSPQVPVLRFYYLPSDVLMGRDPQGFADFRFALVPGGGVMSFSLRLISRADLLPGDHVRAALARRSGRLPSEVELVPLPMTDTKVELYGADEFVSSSLMPPMHIPLSGRFDFLLELSPRGVHWVQERLVRSRFVFAYLTGKVAFRDEKTGRSEESMMSIGLRLREVPFCAVTHDPCRF